MVFVRKAMTEDEAVVIDPLKELLAKDASTYPKVFLCLLFTVYCAIVSIHM